MGISFNPAKFADRWLKTDQPESLGGFDMLSLAVGICSLLQHKDQSGLKRQDILDSKWFADFDKAELEISLLALQGYICKNNDVGVIFHRIFKLSEVNRDPLQCDLLHSTEVPMKFWAKQPMQMLALALGLAFYDAVNSGSDFTVNKLFEYKQGKRSGFGRTKFSFDL